MTTCNPVNAHADTMAAAAAGLDYSRWERMSAELQRDEDMAARRQREERQAREDAERAKRAAMHAQPLGGPTSAAVATNPAAQLDPNQLSEAQKNAFAEQYSKMMSKNTASKLATYKFPETLEEQRVICDEADALRRRGNSHYQAGELMEAAKLYEQAVIKFADWYADCFATEEERALVFSVKLPAHLNLAQCSYKLGNFEHAVTHCTQVIEQAASATAAITTKAHFRRGASYLELGELESAKVDLTKAAELSPGAQPEALDARYAARHIRSVPAPPDGPRSMGQAGCRVTHMSTRAPPHSAPTHTHSAPTHTHSALTRTRQHTAVCASMAPSAPAHPPSRQATRRCVGRSSSCSGSRRRTWLRRER